MSSRTRRNASDDFTCIRCHQHVSASCYGTHHRNHCPFCLWSRHVDEQTGDRRSHCKAPMRPVGIEVRPTGEWAIIHRCTCCDLVRTNRIAGDDSELALLALALLPIQSAPFPLDAYLRR